MVNPGSNTVTIEYPDNWQGPEAGTTATVDIGASPAAPGSPAAARGEPTGAPVVVSSRRTPAKPSTAGPTPATTQAAIPKELKPFIHDDKVDIVGVADRFNSTGNQRYLEAARQVGIEDQDFEAATKFARDHIKAGKNDYIPVDTWNKLPSNIQNTIRDKGLKAGLAQIDRENYAAEQRNEDVEAINKEAARELQKLRAQSETAHQERIEAAATKAMPSREPSPHDTVAERLEIIKGRYEKNKVVAKEVWRGTTPWDESKGETVSPEGAVIMAGEILVPGIYAARNWKELSGGEKAFAVLVDVVTIVPILKGAAVAAKGVGTTGKVARIAASGRALGSEVKALARAPIDVIIHPVQTGKVAAGQVKSLITNLADPRKVPHAVISTTEGTVRLKITQATTAAQAKAIRDEVMRLAVTGQNPVVEMGGVKVTLARSPLMSELKGGVAHTTPMGEVFETGLVVARKPGKPIVEQGLFWSHEPLPKFAPQSAFGMAGDRPTILIADPALVKPQPTNKIYKTMDFETISGKKKGRVDVVEMELKSGIGVEIPKPTQTIYTHIGPTAQRVDIKLIGKSLSKTQIAKLKAKGLVADIKGVLQPAIKVESKSGLPLTGNEVNTLVKVLRRSGARAEASGLRRAERLARSMRYSATLAARSLGGVSNAELIRTIRTTATARAAVPRVSPKSTREKELEEKRRKREKEDIKDARGRVIELDSRGRKPSEDARGRADIGDSRGRKPSEDARGRAPRAEATRIPRTDPGRAPRAEATRIPRTDPGRAPRVTDDKGITKTIDTQKARGKKFSPGMSRKEKITTIKEAGGAVSRRQGELQGRDIWHVWKYPYQSKEDYTLMLGNPPPGSRPIKGPGSAYKSATLLYGKLPEKDTTFDMGFQDVTITTTGVVIFKADPKQLTRNISLSNRKVFPLPRG